MSGISAPLALASTPEVRWRVRVAATSPAFLIGALVLSGWIACALFGRALAPMDPYATDLMATLEGPGRAHWFGTDTLGRDIFSRVIVGARDILTVAPLATLLGMAGGTILGLVGGYAGGWTDAVLGRMVDAVLALPLLVVALFALVALGSSDATVIAAVGFGFTPIVARTVRAAVLAERNLDYVAAARLRGETPLFVMTAEILPNVAAPIAVEATVRLGYAIFTVATLSFLGVGLQPPSADWGLAIAENYALVGGGYWWTVLFDALAIASLVVGVHLVADGLAGLVEG